MHLSAHPIYVIRGYLRVKYVCAFLEFEGFEAGQMIKLYDNMHQESAFPLHMEILHCDLHFVDASIKVWR